MTDSTCPDCDKRVATPADHGVALTHPDDCECEVCAGLCYRAWYHDTCQNDPIDWRTRAKALEAVARAAEEAVDNGGHQEQCDWFPYSQTKPCDCGYSALRDAVNAARSSGARGGAE